MNSIPFPMLSDAHRSMLDGDISLEEVQVAIGDLQSEKTPGVDGLPTEFYSQNVELAPKFKSFFVWTCRRGCSARVYGRGDHCLDT